MPPLMCYSLCCSPSASQLTGISGGIYDDNATFAQLLSLPSMPTYSQVFNKSSMPVNNIRNITTLLFEQTVKHAAAAAAGPASNTAGHSSGSDPTAAQQPTARQFEAQLNFTLQHPIAGSSASTSEGGSNGVAVGPNAFAVGMRILTGHGTCVDVILNGTLAQPAGHGAAVKVTKLSVWVDKRKAGGSTNVTYTEGGPVPLPVAKSWQVPIDKLSLSVWVDHSVIEVYAMGGLARVTSRVYPDGDDVAWGLAAWGVPPQIGGGWRVLLDGRIWTMKNAWLPPDC